MVESGDMGSWFSNTLASARLSESAGFEGLYRGYAGRIRAFAQARGNDDPEGLANDVMLRVFQNLGAFSGDEAAFVRWIFTIARNRLIDLHRQADRRPRLSDDDIPEQPTASAEELALGLLSAEEVVERLGLLTVDQREVIALRLVDDLSLKDVAEITGRPVTAVKALQRRGLKRLQQEFLGEVVSS